MTDNKFTDNEIKKALECHLKGEDEDCNCDICPYRDCGCSLTLCEETLTLINRLETENENYSHNIKQLTEENLILSQKRANIFEIVNANEKGRIRGIKEFAERLKGTIDLSIFGTRGYAISIKNIDDLVKEMESEK